MDDSALRFEREIIALGQHLRARPRSTDLALDKSAYHILLLLDNTESCTLREIADALELEQSTVNRQVNKAIGAGLLEATGTTCPKPIRPTDAGRAAFAHDRAHKLRTIASSLGQLPPAERESLISGLEALNTALEADPQP
ncbi:MarR family transcriptional regulator [Tsukamurella sp. NPDC003166]|uniref:MarR family winged helix-turn-helix transcriptional regulator n=1 Tax=Tsukamurella sp. NPDC003166 TaxID=3154444 RepID=UPI0033B23780